MKKLRGSLAKLEVPPEVIHTLPADFAKRHCILPFKIHNGTLHIATAKPGNQRVIDDIRLLTGLEVENLQRPQRRYSRKLPSVTR